MKNLCVSLILKIFFIFRLCDIILLVVNISVNDGPEISSALKEVMLQFFIKKIFMT